MKKLIKKTLKGLGFEIRRIQQEKMPMPGSESRPIGNIKYFLEDISARGFSPKRIIDVGANYGNWTKMTNSIFPDAQITMIKPQVEMQEALERLCIQCKNLEYIQAGAGRESGELVQTIWEDLAGSSFLPQTNKEELDNQKQRLAKIITLDELIEEKRQPHPCLVKLDVQGYELEVLSGAKTLFGNTELFIMETNVYSFMDNMPTTFDCITFMNNRGYDLYDITEYLRRPMDGALGQIDLAFAKRDGILKNSNHW